MGDRTRNLRKRLRDDGYHYYLAISVKEYENDSSKLLELGTTLYSSHSERISTRHYIVEEHDNLYNMIHVQDYRNYSQFTRTRTVSFERCLAELLHVLQYDDIALVCFGSHIHLRFLKDLKFYNSKEFNLHEDILSIIDHMEVFDVMKMHREHYRRSKFSSLERVAEDFNVDLEDIQLGNAGNDATILIQTFRNFMRV